MQQCGDGYHEIENESDETVIAQHLEIDAVCGASTGCVGDVFDKGFEVFDCPEATAGQGSVFRQ